MTDTVEITDEGVLLRHRITEFERAVAAIADRRPEWHGGVGRWSDSIYDRVRGAILGKGAPLARTSASSRLPGRLGHLDWLHAIDRDVARWSTLPGSTTARLTELRSRSWRVEDGPRLADWTLRLRQLAEDAARLLGEGELHVWLRGYSCPGCSASHAYVGHGGDRRRVPALLATAVGVSCQQCDLSYEPERWPLLAAILTA